MNGNFVSELAVSDTRSTIVLTDDQTSLLQQFRPDLLAQVNQIDENGIPRGDVGPLIVKLCKALDEIAASEVAEATNTFADDLAASVAP